jgi:hypothetical protein
MSVLKCQYYKEKGHCSKGNDPVDTTLMGDCVYKNGEIRLSSEIHCSEGEKLLNQDERDAHLLFLAANKEGIENLKKVASEEFDRTEVVLNYYTAINALGNIGTAKNIPEELKELCIKASAATLKIIDYINNH